MVPPKNSALFAALWLTAFGDELVTEPRRARSLKSLRIGADFPQSGTPDEPGSHGGPNDVTGSGELTRRPGDGHRCGPEIACCRHFAPNFRRGHVQQPSEHSRHSAISAVCDNCGEP